MQLATTYFIALANEMERIQKWWMKASPEMSFSKCTGVENSYERLLET